MADFDALIIGGGPAGYSAALAAARAGAKVALVEPERPGGACVHFACIPTNILLSAALDYVDARALSTLGVFTAGDEFRLGRAVARKDALVKQISGGIATALRTNGVQVIAGRASFVTPNDVEISGESGRSQVSAEAIVIATGTRHETPVLPGIPADHILTADDVQRLTAAPASAIVFGGGPARTAFAIEYAVLLATSGTDVSYLAPGDRLIPGLDDALDTLAAAPLTNLGVRVFYGASVVGGDGTAVTIVHRDGKPEIEADAIVSVDTRRPYFAGLGLDRAGVITEGCIPVGRDCRTNVPHIFAAGDVTGGRMLASAAAQMGDVAGLNAAGGNARTRLDALPHVLHTMPGIAWVGTTEAEARAEGRTLCSGMADLAFDPRAVLLGAGEGAVKVIADSTLGEILGVHAVGPESVEIAQVAAALMQAEVPVADLAAMTFSHPSTAEALGQAARDALR